MLAIRIDFLADRYTATRFDDRNVAEWPPHPGRLFSALVAAWADEPEPSPDERSAIEWLEELDPPHLACDINVSNRNVVTSFVPNSDPSGVDDYSRTYQDLEDARRALAVVEPSDTKVRAKLEKAVVKAAEKARSDSARNANKLGAPSKGLEVLPEHRGRQARTYPTVIPSTPTVSMIWPDAEPDATTAAALETLLSRVARLGHSSSMVACSLIDDPGMATLIPSARGDLILRVPVEGLTSALEHAFLTHQGLEPRVLPNHLVRYSAAGETEPAPPQPALSDSWTLLRLLDADDEPTTISHRDLLGVAKAVRGSVQHHANDPLPEWLSGHQTSGAPTTGPHMAVIPLPFAAHAHADGAVRYVAIALPRSAAPHDELHLGEAIARWTSADRPGELRVPGSRRLRVRSASPGESVTATADTWCRPSRRWVSVTPIVLDRFPKRFFSKDPDKRDAAGRAAAATIATACEHIGLPRPTEVAVSTSALISGSAPARRFPQFRNGQRAYLSLHAELTFAEPVSGPVVLGAGRYLGYGLCTPQDERRDIA